MYVIIIGCGRVGGVLAVRLSSEGHDVVVIDPDEARLKAFDPEFSGRTVRGDGSRQGVLLEAGVERADVLVAATGDDNSNLMSAQVARKVFEVRRVLVRMKDPRKLEVYRELGVEAVSATSLAAERMAEMLKTQEEIEVLGTLAAGAKIVRFRIPSREDCSTIGKMMASGDFGVCSTAPEEGQLLLGLPEGGFTPGMEVVGAVTGERMKVLGRMFKKRAPQAE